MTEQIHPFVTLHLYASVPIYFFSQKKRWKTCCKDFCRIELRRHGFWYQFSSAVMAGYASKIYKKRRRICDLCYVRPQ